MQQGQPIRLEMLLPAGMGIDDALIALAALAMFMIVWSIGQLLVQRDAFAPRLKAIAERRAELKGNLTQARHRKKKNTETISFVRQVVQRLKLLQQHQVGLLQQKLVQAGYRGKDAIYLFAFAKLVMPFAGLAVGFVLAKIDWSHAFATSQAKGWLIFIGCGYFGARLPDILVANAKQKRDGALRKALPDALDLMMICAEAGLSLAAALDRVSRELGRVSPELAEEFSLTSVELGFLPDRSVALKNLGERADIKEVRGFVNVIAQTEKYGTPIAQALRVLSKEFREERMLRAEQKAARLPAMMTVPMIVFILPTLFIIVMAPAIISVLDKV
jgi:tight adherence protein C